MENENKLPKGFSRAQMRETVTSATNYECPHTEMQAESKADPEEGGLLCMTCARLHEAGYMLGQLLRDTEQSDSEPAADLDGIADMVRGLKYSDREGEEFGGWKRGYNEAVEHAAKRISNHGSRFIKQASDDKGGENMEEIREAWEAVKKSCDGNIPLHMAKQMKALDEAIRSGQ